MTELLKRTLGRTDFQVTTLGYGAMELRGAPSGPEVSEAAAENVLNAVLDAGINFIDTSIDYGRSEELIGRFIAHRRAEYFLASKCGCVPDAAMGAEHVHTAENIRAVEDAGIRAYVPLPDWDQRTPFYGPSRFTYNPEQDEYRCPEGHSLPRFTAKYTEGVTVYRADAAICNACPVKAACTTSEHGRMIHRSFDAAYLERVDWTAR